MSKLQTDPLSELGHFKQTHNCLVSSKLICFLGTFHALNTFKIYVLSKKENASGKTDQFWLRGNQLLPNLPPDCAQSG